MNIAIDACQAGYQPRVGIPQYVYFTLSSLLQMDHQNRYTIFYKHGHDRPARTVNSNVHWRPLRSPANHAFWSQVRLPMALMHQSFDVLHVPAHRVPWTRTSRLVTTILDLVFLKHPDTLRPPHRKRLIWYTRNAVRLSERLIAISEATKRDVCELYNFPAERVDAVPLGVDHDTFRPSVSPTVRAVPYVLSVGTLQPRKNYVTLIRAFKRLCETRKEPVELLIAGQRGWLWEPIVREANAPPFAERIHLLGYVSDEQLPSLYAGAALVAMPSLYEGFGLPLVEAMACGAPLVASNIGAFAEVARDAAALVDATDVEAWAETMRALLDDPSRRDQLRQKGLARAKDFSWDRTAQQTLAVYEKTAQQ